MATNLTGYEANIAANLARLIDERPNLNAHRVAEAMKARGVPMDAKAISRIIKGERRLRFNEVVCLSQVLGLSEIRLLTLPPEIARRERLASLFSSWEALRQEALSAKARADSAFQELAEYVQEHHRNSLEDFVDMARDWAENEAAEPAEVDHLHAFLVSSAVPAPAFMAWYERAARAVMEKRSEKDG